MIFFLFFANPVCMQILKPRRISKHETAPASVGDLGSIPGSEQFAGGGNGSPLQYSCLGNRMDRGAWWATVCGVMKSQIRLSN